LCNLKIHHASIHAWCAPQKDFHMSPILLWSLIPLLYHRLCLVTLRGSRVMVARSNKLKDHDLMISTITSHIRRQCATHLHSETYTSRHYGETQWNCQIIAFNFCVTPIHSQRHGFALGNHTFLDTIVRHRATAKSLRSLFASHTYTAQNRWISIWKAYISRYHSETQENCQIIAFTFCVAHIRSPEC